MSHSDLKHNHPSNPFGALETPGCCPRCDQRRAELNAAGRTQHNHAGPFGFRRVADCPRCGELSAGAPARGPGPAVENWQRQQTADAEQVAAIRAHFGSERHRSGGCGLVCTFGDW